MVSRIRFGLLAVSLALLVVMVGNGNAQVLLNEVLADPASDWDGDGAHNSRDDEWVEIVNVGTEAVDLTNYHLAGADGALRYGFSGSLAPGAVRVVYGSESYNWEVATGNPAFGLRLANGGGAITLVVLAADTTQVDCYEYLDHEADDDRSSGRVPDGGTWQLFDALNVYDGTEAPLGSGCVPTPGATVSCPTAVEPKTWGSVKKGG